MTNERTMMFIDGSNFLIELSKELGVAFRAEKPPASAIGLAGELFNHNIDFLADSRRVRTFWFASFQGDDVFRVEYATLLRRAGFEPRLFKRRGDREKGVDIGLTREMLVNAFNDNFDVAFLVAGDEDYVELVNEIKRYGPRVYGAFFCHGLASELQLAFDYFSLIEQIRERPSYRPYIQELERDAPQGNKAA